MIFVDINYWIAIINSNDQWHSRAVERRKSLVEVYLMTTEMVLTETLNHFAEHGTEARKRVAAVVERILARRDIETIKQTSNAFLSGFDFYKSRFDKGYSLTDCVSMNIMRERKIVEVLTRDIHFKQEGFIILL
ncbi:MAG: PIN domain-containing protein [Pyrinomonadaceae bacterium]